MKCRLLTVAVLVGLVAACGADPATDTTTTVGPSTTVAVTTTTVVTTTTLAAPTEPDLAAELIAMFEADQEERASWDNLAPGEPLPPSGDGERTARLREIIAEYGWPTFEIVGVDGATAAWVIAQHADLDPDFQVEALGYLQEAVANGQGDPIEMAYLTDRVASSSGEPQTYGTQIGCVGGEIGPMPELAEPDRVDELRAEVGMGTLDEYYDEFPSRTC